MKTRIDKQKIAKELGAESRGKVSSTGGFFGALQLRAEVEARFRVPAGGGRATDPEWTERRLVPLSPETLSHLEDLSARLREHSGLNLAPMQLAALLLEKMADQVTENEAEELMLHRRPTG